MTLCRKIHILSNNIKHKTAAGSRTRKVKVYHIWENVQEIACKILHGRGLLWGYDTVKQTTWQQQSLINTHNILSSKMLDTL